MGKGCKKKFKKNYKKESHNKHDKNKDKNIFFIGLSEYSSDYENKIQCLTNNIKKECARVNDVSEALHNLDRPDIIKWTG